MLLITFTHHHVIKFINISWGISGDIYKTIRAKSGRWLPNLSFFDAINADSVKGFLDTCMQIIMGKDKYLKIL